MTSFSLEVPAVPEAPTSRGSQLFPDFRGWRSGNKNKSWRGQVAEPVMWFCDSRHGFANSCPHPRGENKNKKKEKRAQKSGLVSRHDE